MLGLVQAAEAVCRSCGVGAGALARRRTTNQQAYQADALPPVHSIKFEKFKGTMTSRDEDQYQVSRHRPATHALSHPARSSSADHLHSATRRK